MAHSIAEAKSKQRDVFKLEDSNTKLRDLLLCLEVCVNTAQQLFNIAIELIDMSHFFYTSRAVLAAQLSPKSTCRTSNLLLAPMRYY